MDELETGTAEAVTESTSTPEPTMDDTMSAVFDKMNETAPRDESGRFASKNPSVPEEEAAQDGEAEAKPDPVEKPEAEPEEKPDVPEVEAVELPEGLTAEEREAVAKMPKEAQEAFTRLAKGRQAELTRKSQEAAELRRRVDPIDRIVAPLRSALQRSGVNEADYLHRLVTADRALSQNPQKFIRAVAQGYGLDLQNLAVGAEQDPHLSALERQVQSLQQVLTQQQQRETANKLASTQSEVETFAAEKGSDGKPLRPYFDEVFDDMLPIVDGLKRNAPSAPPRELLAKAYKMAMAANETVQAKITAEAKKAEEAKRKSEAEKAAAEARKSATPGFKGGRTTKAKAASWDETMSEAFDRAQG